MKSLLRPTTLDVNTRNLSSVFVQNHHQFSEFDKAWKLAVAADRNRPKKAGPSIFAELSILRNIVLGRCIYTGFTPKLRQNNLKNGYGFMDGFSTAYKKLKYALESKQPTRTQHACHGLLLSFSHWPQVTRLVQEMQDPMDFSSEWFRDVYVSRVHKMVVKLQDGDTNLQGSSYDDLFDLFDKEHRFHLISKDDFIAGEYEDRKMSAMLQTVAEKYMELKFVGRNKSSQKIESVYIVDDPEWLYSNSDGVDQRDDAHIHGSIAIHTLPAQSRVKGSPNKYLIPVSYLWETEWMEGAKK